MADAYGYLTDSERVTFNEASRLMALSDWAGWDDDLQTWFDVTQKWIRDRRTYISDLATGEAPSGNGPGWETAHRRERYDYLHKANYSDADAHDLCQLPTEAGTDAEKVYISHREMWWREPKGAYSEQSARRQATTDWLIARRQFVYRCANGTAASDPNAAPNGYSWKVPTEVGWDYSNRRQRYSNLCVATKFGSAYEDWTATHNTTTGAPKGGDSGGSGSTSSRDKALAWMSSHLGLYEDPAGSNCDSRSDGIRAAQDRCAGGGTWLRKQPWCGVWCFNALQVAGVSGLNSNLASVAWCEDQAKAGRAPFTGWTTDGSKARPGDLVVMFGYGGHVGMLRKIASSSVADTVEGNTSDTSANRSRSRSSDVRGYCLVAYP